MDLISIESRTYTANTRSFEASIPINVSFVNLELTRENWGGAGTKVISFESDLSLNGGLTWIPRFLCFGAHGGIIYDQNSVFISASSASRKIPEPSNPNRRIRVRVINTISLKTAIKVVVD